MVIKLSFEKKKKNSEKFDSEISKFQLVNESEHLDILPVHIKEWLTLYQVFNVSSCCHNLKCNDRLINGLFHSRCLDFHGKIIILKLALSE